MRQSNEIASLSLAMTFYLSIFKVLYYDCIGNKPEEG
jgi:hypothetical protein